MKIKIRTHPIDIFLLTGDEAKDARAAAYCEDDMAYRYCGLTAFVTGSFGHDGFVWDTAEEFESDWQMSFGGIFLPVD